jgi:hypothetical protein
VADALIFEGDGGLALETGNDPCPPLAVADDGALASILICGWPASSLAFFIGDAGSEFFASAPLGRFIMLGPMLRCKCMYR